MMSYPRSIQIVMQIVWLTAVVGIVLPFALGTSPLDALLLRVPNNEGNWLVACTCRVSFLFVLAHDLGSLAWIGF